MTLCEASQRTGVNLSTVTSILGNGAEMAVRYTTGESSVEERKCCPWSSKRTWEQLDSGENG
jgi:hypothetical protein